MTATTVMSREIAQTATICEAQIRLNADLVRETGRRLRDLNAPFAATLARGSSDQAASFAKVLIETRAATPTLSHSPSIGALYAATSPRFKGIPLIVISQSGRSPDLIKAAQDARRCGAVVISIVNDPESPLAGLSDITIPVHAGVETSVAATKSFVATLVAIVHLVAEWSGDAGLLTDLASIGTVLRAAQAADWSPAVGILADSESLLVLGRGLTLPIAGEAALKLKETAGLHAEAFSIAEVAHGPMTLVGAGSPVFVFGPIDAARSGLRERLADFAARGAVLIATGAPEDLGAARIVLPAVAGCDPVLNAIASILSFYGLANRLAIRRGRDPDSPPHLLKVTRTL